MSRRRYTRHLPGHLARGLLILGSQTPEGQLEAAAETLSARYTEHVLRVISDREVAHIPQLRDASGQGGYVKLDYIHEGGYYPATVDVIPYAWRMTNTIFIGTRCYGDMTEGLKHVQVWEIALQIVARLGSAKAYRACCEIIRTYNRAYISYLHVPALFHAAMRGHHELFDVIYPLAHRANSLIVRAFAADVDFLRYIQVTEINRTRSYTYLHYRAMANIICQRRDFALAQAMKLDSAWEGCGGDITAFTGEIETKCIPYGFLEYFKATRSPDSFQLISHTDMFMFDAGAEMFMYLHQGKLIDNDDISDCIIQYQAWDSLCTLLDNGYRFSPSDMRGLLVQAIRQRDDDNYHPLDSKKLLRAIAKLETFVSI